MIDLINLDPASTQAMLDEINLLKDKLDYLNDGNRKLHASYQTRTQKLQNKLDICENQIGAIISLKSRNQVLERQIKGIGRRFVHAYKNINFIMRLRMVFFLILINEKNCNLKKGGMLQGLNS